MWWNFGILVTAWEQITGHLLLLMAPKLLIHVKCCCQIMSVSMLDILDSTSCLHYRLPDEHDLEISQSLENHHEFQTCWAQNEKCYKFYLLYYLLNFNSTFQTVLFFCQNLFPLTVTYCIVSRVNSTSSFIFNKSDIIYLFTVLCRF